MRTCPNWPSDAFMSQPWQLKHVAQILVQILTIENLLSIHLLLSLALPPPFQSSLSFSVSAGCPPSNTSRILKQGQEENMIVADFAHLGNHLFEIPVLCISACTRRHGNRFSPIKIMFSPITYTHTHTKTHTQQQHHCQSDWTNTQICTRFYIIQAIYQC